MKVWIVQRITDYEWGNGGVVLGVFSDDAAAASYREELVSAGITDEIEITSLSVDDPLSVAQAVANERAGL